MVQWSLDMPLDSIVGVVTQTWNHHVITSDAMGVLCSTSREVSLCWSMKHPFFTAIWLLFINSAFLYYYLLWIYKLQSKFNEEHPPYSQYLPQAAIRYLYMYWKYKLIGWVIYQSPTCHVMAHLHSSFSLHAKGVHIILKCLTWVYIRARR